MSEDTKCKDCLGCVYFSLRYCELHVHPVKFPGKRCDDWTPKERRYLDYNHETYCKKKGIAMCDE